MMLQKQEDAENARIVLKIEGGGQFLYVQYLLGTIKYKNF